MNKLQIKYISNMYKSLSNDIKNLVKYDNESLISYNKLFMINLLINLYYHITGKRKGQLNKKISIYIPQIINQYIKDFVIIEVNKNFKDILSHTMLFFNTDAQNIIMEQDIYSFYLDLITFIK